MTVRAVLLNCGDHPDDAIRVDGQILKRGEFLSLTNNEPVCFEVVHHGSGKDCLQHEPAVLLYEGPGASLVRVKFNPSSSGTVNRIKTLAAALINEIEATQGDRRNRALAQTAIEEGAMWAVKAVTAA